MRTTTLWLALGIVVTAAAALAAPSDEQRAVPVFRTDIQPGRTVVTAQPAALVHGSSQLQEDWRQTVVLPPDATRWSVTVDGPDGERDVAAELLGHLRGLPVLSWVVEDAAAGDVATVEHDGDWAARHASRGFDAALAAALPGWRAPAAGAANGCYLVICPPDYVDAVTPLLDWKREKGLDVRLATTDETGVANTAIQAWLRDAYATWDVPPEYVLLVGDVDVLPAWSFSDNVTDLPYTHMDLDDWLPDLLLGRWPVADAQQAAVVAAKTVAYEKTPYRGDEGWFSRQLMVGGNYSSTTPVSTVQWVGEQLEGVGFEPASEVLYPPFWDGRFPVRTYLEAGVGMCVYRGWAYGTAGWEPPHFTVDDIPTVETGAMTPIVMSFVCLNGDFAGEDPCFGEVFLRQGSLAEPKGAVAFVGNGEHWSHTRYNDAMAISYFEVFPDEGVTDLGVLSLAAKLRYMAYFPHEMPASEFGEESVEFYFHIYSLLGDPELNVWKGAPQDMDVTYDAVLPGAARRLDVRVADAVDAAAVSGALVGVVAGEELLGRARTRSDGLAVVELDGWDGQQALTVTVTAPGRFAHVGMVDPSSPASFVGVSDADTESGTTVAPGQTVVLHPVLSNGGATATGTVELALSVRGPATVGDASLSVIGVPGQGSFTCTGDQSVEVTVDADARDGQPLELLFLASHDLQEDLTVETWTVAASSLVLKSAAPDGDGVVDPGETVNLDLLLGNDGSVATAGGTLTAELITPDVGSLGVGSVDFDALEPGADVLLDAALELSVDADVPVGTGLTLRLSAVTEEGWEQITNRSLTVGSVDSGAPVGPDAYGYWALDSADLDYPALVPEYRWTELDPLFGGEGVAVPFAEDNEVVLAELPFPFTYYGQTYTGDFRISENGWISFDTDDAYEFYNWPVPNAHGNHSMVAPFWENFDPTHERTGGVFTRYDETAGTFTVEWSSMYHYRPEITDAQTFQLVLFDPAVHPTATGDGKILFLYRQVADTDYLRQYATVGLEDASETDGLQLSYANRRTPGTAPVGPGLAVLLTTDTPVRVPYEVETFKAEGGAGGVLLSWRVDDPRPVLAWRVRRLTAGGAELATRTLLPADARSWFDAEAPDDASLRYQLEAVHPFDHVNRVGVAAVGDGADVRPVAGFALDALRPNPSRGRTELSFALPAAASATLRVYDAAGRLVRTLVSGTVEAGPGRAVWDGRAEDGREAGAGVYFVRLRSGGEERTRKLLLVR